MNLVILMVWIEKYLPKPQKNSDQIQKGRVILLKAVSASSNVISV